MCCALQTSDRRCTHGSSTRRRERSHQGRWRSGIRRRVRSDDDGDWSNYVLVRGFTLSLAVHVFFDLVSWKIKIVSRKRTTLSLVSAGHTHSTQNRNTTLFSTVNVARHTVVRRLLSHLSHTHTSQKRDRDPRRQGVVRARPPSRSAPLAALTSAAIRLIPAATSARNAPSQTPRSTLSAAHIHTRAATAAALSRRRGCGRRGCRGLGQWRRGLRRGCHCLGRRRRWRGRRCRRWCRRRRSGRRRRRGGRCVLLRLGWSVGEHAHDDATDVTNHVHRRWRRRRRTLIRQKVGRCPLDLGGGCILLVLDVLGGFGLHEVGRRRLDLRRRRISLRVRPRLRLLRRRAASSTARATLGLASSATLWREGETARVRRVNAYGRMHGRSISGRRVRGAPTHHACCGSGHKRCVLFRAFGPDGRVA